MGARSTPRRRGFSLIELVVTTTVMLVLAGVGLSMFMYTDSEAKEAARTQEMATIRDAFGAYEGDCLPDDADLQDVSEYGLWPLFGQVHPDTGTTLDGWDYDRNRGWRGPYAVKEDVVDIDPTTVGQPAGAVSVPVAEDPWGGYYRVMAPAGVDPSRFRKLAVVCTGPDTTLQTTDVPVDGDVAASGDDTVLRLLPMAP